MVTIITDERCTAYAAAGHPERPTRISSSVSALRQEKGRAITWDAPALVSDADILLAHAPEHLKSVREPLDDFDGDTPAHANIDAHARRSVGGALRAMNLAVNRARTHPFSLMRPPGHHATANRAMGFCYFNSIAIAALAARQLGIERVAVFDFDVHHGNGTEAILRDKPHVAFASVHQSPCYPGTGTEDVGKNCFNFPLSPRTDRATYRETLSRALDRLMATRPQLLAISAGFDCYARDPLAQETLEAEDFHWLGHALAITGLPSFSVLEGGYSDDLPQLILAYLAGIAAP